MKKSSVLYGLKAISYSTCMDEINQVMNFYNPVYYPDLRFS